MKFFKPLFYLLLAMIVLGIVVELLIRFVWPQPVDPGHRFVLNNEIEGVKSKVEFLIDENHIRGFDSSSKKSDGGLRILCVGGGSTITMLQNVEDTWWGQLDAKLEKSLGKPVEVGALITPASQLAIGGAQWTDHLLDKIDGVDLVIAMYGHADLLMPDANFSFEPSAVKPIEFEHRSSFAGELAKSSHLVRVARNLHVRSKRSGQEDLLEASNHIRDRFIAVSAGFRSLTSTTAAPPRQTDPVAAYLHGVRLFVEVAKRHEVKLVVVGEPTVFSANPSPDVAGTFHSAVHVGPGEKDYARPLPDWVDRELVRYHTAGKQLCDGAGIAFLPLHGGILPNRGNFITETTLSDEGAKELAEKLFSEVIKTLR